MIKSKVVKNEIPSKTIVGQVFQRINHRCSNPKSISYSRYGGKGIKALLTREEIKSLWIRDKAHLLKRPSIDRIDSNGNYEYSNCRFIELRENILLSFGPRTHCAHGHKLEGDNLKFFVTSKGYRKRRCAICIRMYSRKHYYKRRKLALDQLKGGGVI